MTRVRVLSGWSVTKENIAIGADAIKEKGFKIDFQIEREEAFFVGMQEEISKALEYIQNKMKEKKS